MNDAKNDAKNAQYSSQHGHPKVIQTGPRTWVMPADPEGWKASYGSPKGEDKG